MSFNGAIHSFQIASPRTPKSSFFYSPENRKELYTEIKKQLQWEKGTTSLGNENSKDCPAHIHVKKDNFLTDLQEYAANQEKLNLDEIYMGEKQSCYNHLIEIRDSIGVYLPVHFFFPLMISIKQHTFPIFVGSSVKLYGELKQLNRTLEADKKVNPNELSLSLDASEEDVEDYEASYDEVENFWACFAYQASLKLVTESIKNKLPLFVF